MLMYYGFVDWPSSRVCERIFISVYIYIYLNEREFFSDFSHLFAYCTGYLGFIRGSQGSQ